MSESMIDGFFWWSGVVTWGILGVLALLELGDFIIDRAVNSIWTKREFLAFVADRLKRRAALKGEG